MSIVRTDPHIDERQAALRDAALHVANDNLKKGKSISESVELAIDYLYSQTTAWCQEDEMRAWLKAQLGSSPETMKTESVKEKPTILSQFNRNSLVAGGMGLALGLLIGFLLLALLPHPDEFVVQIMNNSTAIKVNKRTGETWKLHREPGGYQWEPLQNGTNVQR